MIRRQPCGKCAPRNHTDQLKIRPGHAWSFSTVGPLSAMSWRELIRNGTSGRSVLRCFLRASGSFVALRMTAKCCDATPASVRSPRRPPANFGVFHFELDPVSLREMHLRPAGRFRELELDEVEWSDETDNISMKVRDPDN